MAGLHRMLCILLKDHWVVDGYDCCFAVQMEVQQAAQTRNHHVECHHHFLGRDDRRVVEIVVYSWRFHLFCRRTLICLDGAIEDEIQLSSICLDDAAVKIFSKLRLIL